jgi:hypothetical protein
VGLERGLLSLVNTIEELFGTKSSGFGLETREYGRRDTSRCPGDTLCPQKLVLTSPRRGDRSVGVVRWRTQATEFSYSFSLCFGTKPTEPFLYYYVDQFLYTFPLICKYLSQSTHTHTHIYIYIYIYM